MARRALPDSDHVPIGLTVSETDAAQIDEVLTRPEFAGWSRSEWCREIIRTALRYYMREPAAGAGEARGSARPAVAQPAPASERPPPPGRQSAPSSRQSASSSRQSAPIREPAAPPAASEPAAAGGPLDPAPREARPDDWDVPEQPAQPDCPHPADARDYERGVCAACGAVIWD